MDGTAWSILIVAVALVVLFLIITFRFPEEARSIVRRLHKASFTLEGVSIEFFSEAIREKEGHEPDQSRLGELLRKLPQPADVIWVDDNPINNVNEVQALRAAGLGVDVATSNAEAAALARYRLYDAAISDIKRSPPEDQNAGLALEKSLKSVGDRRSSNIPIIYYVGSAQQAETAGGWPVTDSPEDLLRVLIQVLSKERHVRHGKTAEHADGSR
ncbi:hypothetical protein [Streptomyces sp. NPDC002132]|uniref:hypothetical protein n=1 Tax=unclassified Streptomyces TaxID=2593676 RepID=UPI003330A800